MVTIDFETRSELDVTKVGAFAYAEHPSTDVMCMAWGSAHLPTRLWFPGRPFPFALNSSFKIEAHNVEFERQIWLEVMVRKYEWPPVANGRWRCSAAKSRYNSIPGKLENGAEALELTNRKDTTGHRIMLRMSKPRKPTKKDPISSWHELPKDKVKLYAYCKQDVDTELELSSRLRGMSRFEHEVWLLDQRMNQRGLLVDVKAIDGALKIVEEFHTTIGPQLEELTGGEINSLGQVAKVTEWCNEQIRPYWGNGMAPYALPNLQAVTVESALKLSGLPENVRIILKLRQSVSKTSVRKLHAMKARRSTDGRCRGTVKYCGAERTGRWSGAGIQTQNLPKGNLDDIWAPEALKAIYNGSLAAVALLGEPLEVLSSCIRRMIVAAPDKIFHCADFKAIEARVLAWLSGDLEALRRFRDDIDPYVDMASKLYGITHSQVSKKQREFGKKVVLALGYGMGAEKLYSECKKEGIKVTKEFCEAAIKFYRWKEYRTVTNLWDVHEEATIRVIRSGAPEDVGLIRWGIREDFLHATLPSGRSLSYYKPKVQWVKTPWDESKEAMTYMGINSRTKQWERESTYGGKIIENLVQATARDFMAESILRVEKAGYCPVLTVHDEILTEDDESFGSLEEFISLIEQLPDWGEGCPITAEGWKGNRYKK